MRTEPWYFVNPNRSGVDFARSAHAIPSGCVAINPEQVDPEIRAEGRAWFATHKES